METLYSDQDISEFGRLLDQAWRIKRSFSGKVSNAHVDGIYDAAIEAGAIGGKILGAGGGGFMVLFVPPERQQRVREKLKDFIHVPFRFESTGSQIIFYDPEQDFAFLDNERNGHQMQEFRELDSLAP